MDKIRILHPHPALLIQHGNMKYLVITDLHIGFEEKLFSAGVKITMSVQKMLDELMSIVSEYKPDHLMILGDIKYSVNKISVAEWQLVPKFLEKISKKIKTTIVPGNHDAMLTPLLPQNVIMEDVKGVKLGKNILLHGHTNPIKEWRSPKRMIMGHTHPTYNMSGSPLSGRPVWLLLRAKGNIFYPSMESDRVLEVMVIPSFNRELSTAGYSAFHGKTISPLLRRMKDYVYEALITTLDGEIIGDAESVKHVI